MKNIFLLVITFASISAFAQHDGRGVRGNEQARDKIRAAHAAYITQRIELTSSESEKFWPLYREYFEKRRDLRQRMRDARQSESNEKDLLEMDLSTKEEELELERELMEKLQEFIPAEKLVKLRQAEIDFRKLLLRKVQERRRR
jgi:hypothetical protein